MKEKAVTADRVFLTHFDIRGSNTKILTLWMKFMNFQKTLSNIIEAFIVKKYILSWGKMTKYQAL